jgi:Zn-dependent alcohol dehydrogenases
VALNLLPVFADQLTITGSIMGTLKDMEDMVRLIALTGIEPEIGSVVQMERAEEGFEHVGREGRAARRSSPDEWVLPCISLRQPSSQSTYLSRRSTCVTLARLTPR